MLSDGSEDENDDISKERRPALTFGNLDFIRYFCVKDIDRTMLFVIEGLDGAGKSTQVNKLKEYLGSFDTPLEYIHFPRYDAPIYGELISRFLKGDFGSNESVHPQLVALLFAEDRHDAGTAMRSTLRKGGNVLLTDMYIQISPISAQN